MAQANVDFETESMINSVLFGEKSQKGSARPQSNAQSRASNTARPAKPSARYQAKAKPAQD